LSSSLQSQHLIGWPARTLVFAGTAVCSSSTFTWQLNGQHSSIHEASGFVLNPRDPRHLTTYSPPRPVTGIALLVFVWCIQCVIKTTPSPE
jgi:hypothetical protein